MIKVRIAPSPTGPLHVGTARTTLFVFAFARSKKGNFLLRIDDTDKERSNPAFEENIKEGLGWLGITWDSFFRQSERTRIYKDHLQKLLEEKKIFWCSHTSEELAREREEFMNKKEAPRHVCAFREGGKKEGILRFKNNASEAVIFRDIIRGDISIRPHILGDFSVAKDMENPLYNFTTVVDDGLENITHIIRGEDHIPNTPKQILIQEALGVARPEYAHLPLLLGKDRSKLSKRHGPTSLMQYKEEGYLPEAMINFLGLLGWHPPKELGDEEIFGIEDLIAHFSLEDVQKSGAIFDAEKLKWFNSAYIKKMDLDTLSLRACDYLKPERRDTAAADKEWWRNIIALEQSRLVMLGEIGERTDYFFEDPIPKKEILMEGLNDPQRIAGYLSKVIEILSSLDENDFSERSVQDAVMPYAASEGKKEVLWPFRVALTGKRASPGLFEVAALLGKKRTILRAKNAVEVLLA